MSIHSTIAKYLNVAQYRLTEVSEMLD